MATSPIGKKLGNVESDTYGKLRSLYIGRLVQFEVIFCVVVKLRFCRLGYLPIATSSWDVARIHAPSEKWGTSGILNRWPITDPAANRYRPMRQWMSIRQRVCRNSELGQRSVGRGRRSHDVMDL